MFRGLVPTARAMLVAMFELLLQRPSFRRLWAAGAVSLVGDWLGFVAISRLALDKGGGPLALALVFAAHTLPHAFGMPITGVFADRFDRRKLLVIVPLVQMLLTVAMVFAASSGALVALQALVVARTTIGSFMVPAEAAALRHTVEPSELVRANALLSGTWSFTYVAGMALGGVLATLGPVIALSLDAASFFVAAMLSSGLPSMKPEQSAAERASGAIGFIKAMPGDLKKAFDHARAHPSLFRAMLGKIPVAVAGGAGWMLLNLVADRAKPLGTAAISLGILQAIRGAGTGIGPILVAAYTKSAPPPRWLTRAAVLLSFSGIAVFPLAATNPALLLFITLAWGMGTGSNWVMSTASLQRLSPGDMIGRLSSIDELWTTVLLVLGALVAAAMLEKGVSMPGVAAIGITLGLVLMVWLDQRKSGTESTLDPAAAPNPSRAA